VTEGTSELGRMQGVGRRSHQAASLLAWLVWALVMVTAAASVVLDLWNFSEMNSSLEGTDYLSELIIWTVLLFAAIPAYATVGAVVASRHPGNWVGWLCLAMGAVIAFHGAGAEYAARALKLDPGSLPAGVAAAWVGDLLQPALLLPVLLILLLFPNGRLPSHRWRLVAWAVVVLQVLGMFEKVVGPTVGDVIDKEVFRNPTSIESLEGVGPIAEAISFLSLPLLLLASVASIWVRWRRAGDVEREQIKWLVYAAACGAAVLGGVASLILFGEGSYAAFFFFSVGFAAIFLGVPVAIGIAILKYRLYDIDLLINRTLVYATLTGMLALVYFGGVTATQALLRTFTGQQELPQLAVVASTLLIAALFNPLRHRIQSFIDRSFYRRKYDAAKTLEGFSMKLRDETDLEALSDDLVGVVRETMQPSRVSLWLRSEMSSKGEQPDPRSKTMSGDLAPH
jgi:hypothetical protein